MSQPPNKSPASFRHREHRLSSLPVKDIIKTRMAELELKNQDIHKPNSPKQLSHEMNADWGNTRWETLTPLHAFAVVAGT